MRNDHPRKKTDRLIDSQPSSYSLTEQCIVDLIEGLIYSGKLEPGEKIPSEHDLTDQFNTSRNQVRQALSLLEKKGLIFRRQGSGSYVQEINKKSFWRRFCLSCKICDKTSIFPIATVVYINLVYQII